MEDLGYQLEDIKARLKDGLTSSDKDFIKNNYERIVRKIFSNRNCGQCYQDAFIEMYTSFKKYGIRKMGNFKLKNGVVLQSASFSEVVTNQNITDELALKWLKDNPRRIGLFMVFPENWESQLKKLDNVNERATEEKQKKNKKAKSTKKVGNYEEAKEMVDTPEVEKTNEE